MIELNILIYLAITAFVAFLIKRLTGIVGIPIVTGYVIVGVVMGISLLQIFHSAELDRLDIVNDFALGIIGFTIGSELRREVFVKLGRSIILIATFESILTFLIVTASVFLLDPSKVYQAFILGAVASATAPAATVYIIQQYKAKGPLSSTILAVVGIDDAFALIIFVFAAALSKGILKAEHVSLLSILIPSLLEILLSIVLGILLGFGFIWIFRKVRYPDDLLLGTAAFVLFSLGISQLYHLSGLLSTMTFGAVVSNLNPMLNNRSSKILESVSPLLFAFFFIFAGAHLDVGLLPQIGIVGLVYLVARIVGKVGGAHLGAYVGKAPDVVKKYVGFSLIPQVGVALALAIIVRKEFGSDIFGEPGRLLASIVINVLLFTTIITEIVGPLFTKHALTKSGERNA